MTYVIDSARFGGAGSTLLNGLVSWWTLDETSGTRYDSHGSNDLADNATVGYRTGKQSNSTDHIAANKEYLHDSTFSGLVNTDDITIAFWVLIDAQLTDWQGCVYLQDGETNAQAITIAPSTWGNPNTVRIAVYDDNGVAIAAQDHGDALSAATWYHVLVEIDYSEAVCSIQINNGTKITSAAFTGLGVIRTPLDRITMGRNGPNDNQYLDGSLDEVGVWQRILTNAEKAQLYNSGSGITYNDIAVGSWSYSSLASAEASGDGWVDGDTIKILGGATFLYKSALATNGHSGLIHKDPFNDGTTISALTLRAAEGPNTDPDSWISGDATWTDVSAGTKTSDWDFDTATGPTTGVTNSRLRDMTTAGRAIIRYENTPTDTESFVIVRDFEVDRTVTSDYLYVYCQAYKDASNVNRVVLIQTSTANSGLVQALADAWYDTTIDCNTLHDLWLYVKGSAWAIWVDGDSGPASSGTIPSTSTANTFQVGLVSGKVGISGYCDAYLSSVLTGGMTTA